MLYNTPMAYAILRTAKLSTMGQVATSARHTFREQEVENANELETELNLIEGATTSQELVDAVKARLTLVETRSATKPVICIEYMITASPEAFQRHSGHLSENTQYFDDAKKWLHDRHGKDNVVSCTVHKDERTPHLVAYVVPLVEREGKTRRRSVIVGKGTDGKPIRETREFTEKNTVSLCAKEFLGGREKLRAMQTEFAEKVGDKYGLERGKLRSTAKHQTVRAFYAAIERPIVKEVNIEPTFLEPKLLKKGLLTSEYETPQMVATRVTKAVQKAYDPAVNMARLAESSQQRTKSLEVTTKNTEKRFNALQAEFDKIKQNGREIMNIIVRGGDDLVKLHEAMKEQWQKATKLSRERSPHSRDRGRSR